MVELAIAPARPQAQIASEPFHCWSFPNGTPWTEFYREGGGYLLRFPDLADFRVTVDGTYVTCHPAPDVSEATVRHLHLNQVVPLALSKQGRLVFHASAIEIDGGAVAFVGASGRGKSTLAAGFAIDGHSFLTDDGLLVEQVDHGHVVMPGYPSIRLWDDSEKALIAPGAPTAPAVHFTSKARFLAGERLSHCAEPRPLRYVYFLGEGSAPRLVIRPLTGSQAMVEWVRHSFLLDLEEKPRLATHFEQVASLAERPIHAALDFPRHFDDFPRVRAAIIEHLRNSSN